MKNSSVCIPHIVLGVFLTLSLIVIAIYSLIIYIRKSISEIFSDFDWINFFNEDCTTIDI